MDPEIQAVDGRADRASNTGWDVPSGVICMIAGSSAVYATLFATGHVLYGELGAGLAFGLIAVVSVLVLFRSWRRVRRLDPGAQT